jgi:hypothetical protein
MALSVANHLSESLHICRIRKTLHQLGQLISVINRDPPALQTFSGRFISLDLRYS